MMTRNKTSEPQQGDLFKAFLKNIIDLSHPMARLAEQVDWKQFEEALACVFADEQGRPSADVRLVIGLMYLKYAYDLSDDEVVAAWVENPYWQYFTGSVFFEHQPPIDSSSLTNWRKRIGEAGAEQMLAETLRTGLKTRMIRPKDLKRVNVDTTVQEKGIRFPTDARLYHRSLEVLVRLAKRHGICLRQTYVRVSKKSMLKLGGYAKAKQFKRAKRETKFLRTRLGRVLRDFQNKASVEILQEYQVLLDRMERIRTQQRHDHHKVYSVHAPEVECIAKGKVHKQYEFGVKVGLVSTSKGNWIVGAKAFPGNPYDGHTLPESLAQAERLMGIIPEMACCDLGYRKSGYEGPCDIQVVNRFRKRLPNSLRKWWKRRSAIEPVIGHVKSDCRGNRNRLKGTDGDKVNAILAAAAYNFRKLMKGLALLLRRLLDALRFLLGPLPQAA
jgi:transposase, IS5 family